MRKAAIAVLAAVAVGACGFAGEAPEPTGIEQLVPSSAVALVQVTSLPELRAAFEQSALAEAVQGSQMLRYLHTVAGAAADFAAVALSGRPADEARGLVGGQVGLVLLDFKSREDARQRVPVALLVEAADAARLERIVTEQFQLLALLRPELQPTVREQAGTAVHELALPKGGHLAYASRGKFLLVGSRDAVNTLLAGQQESLAGHPTYQAVRAQLATTGGLTAYVDVRKLLERTGAAGNPMQMQKLRGAGLSEIQAAGLALDFHGRQVRERLYLHTGGPQTGILKLLTTGAPVDPTLNGFVPPDYTVVATLALKEAGLWARAQQLITDVQGEAAAGNLDAGANMVQQNFGIQIREGFFDTLTDELFIAVDLRKLPAFSGSGRQPKAQEIPFVAGAKVRDEVRLLETLERLAANERLFEMGVERKVTKHGGSDVFSFRIPFQSDLQPTYAVVDKVLLFGIRPESVTAAIEARRTKKRFAATPAAAAVAGPAHLRLQVNDGQLLTTLLAMVRSDAPEAAQRLLPELERVLGGLHGHAAVVRREAQGISLVAQSDLGTTGTFLVAAVLLDQFHAIVAKRVNGDFDQVAAALERHRAQHGAYPETLTQLVPGFLAAIPRDRFAPKRAYGYSRGTPGLDGKLPDAWCLTSVGPDEREDIPVEQFDPPVWQQRATAPGADELPGIKRVVYQFRKEQFKDEQKNDDEGDIIRMGGKGLAGKATAPGTAPRPAPRPKPPMAPPDF